MNLQSCMSDQSSVSKLKSGHRSVLAVVGCVNLQDLENFFA